MPPTSIFPWANASGRLLVMKLLACPSTRLGPKPSSSKSFAAAKGRLEESALNAPMTLRHRPVTANGPASRGEEALRRTD